MYAKKFSTLIKNKSALSK